MTGDNQIRGAARAVYLLGFPVAHSLSPQIHNFAFRKLELPYMYVPLPIKPEHLHHAVFLLRASSALGANVTLPHKQRAASFCDVLSPLSSRIGTVNTLYFRDGMLCGTTTDPEGFLRALASMGHDAHGGHIVIIGNGGTARTLATALALERIPESLAIVGRNPYRASALAKEITGSMGFGVDSCALDQPDLADYLRRCTLLVNCTSAGLYPAINETPLAMSYFHPGMTVFDAIYNPSRTRFLAEAEAAGCRIQNGLRMLLYQGLASFSLWTGIDVREEIFDLKLLQESI